ncbi:MAG: DUF3883 domain-containing protein [Brevundimonas sp.]|nr:MAG: DUF3883 domain-containing protein [Brevundimonas sp.]
MADQSKVGTDWQADELEAIVADYFSMLVDEVAGRSYVKSRHNAALQARIGRTAGSIERKHMNISAVLRELSLPFIDGYKPFSNYQDALGRTIERYLVAHPNILIGETMLPTWARTGELQPAVGFSDAPSLFEDPGPPSPAPPRAPRPAGLERLVRKFDPTVRDFRNRALGKAGEALVVDFEQRRLTALERPDLAEKVRWVAQDDGDGAGYDVHSFDRLGNDRLIEVKATNGGRTSPFFITRNELALSEERPDHFRLYRLYDLAKAPRMFRLKPPIPQAVTLEPETWRARVS